MRRQLLLSALALTAAMFAASACDMMKSTPDAPKVGSLTQRLTMVDAEGRIYGTVELDPINGGKVYDSDGRMIGRVIAPVPGTLAPTVQ